MYAYVQTEGVRMYMYVNTHMHICMNCVIFEVILFSFQRVLLTLRWQWVLVLYLWMCHWSLALVWSLGPAPQCTHVHRSWRYTAHIWLKTSIYMYMHGEALQVHDDGSVCNMLCMYTCKCIRLQSFFAGAQQLRHSPSALPNPPSPPLYLSPSHRAHPTLTHSHPLTHILTQTTGTPQFQVEDWYFGTKIKCMFHIQCTVLHDMHMYMSSIHG